VRNRLLLTAALASAALAALLWLAPRQAACALTGCKDTYGEALPPSMDFRCNLQEADICPFVQTKHWTVYFLDGYERNIDVVGDGQKVASPNAFCAPVFRDPTFVNETSRTGRWTQLVHNGAYEPSSTGCSNSAQPRVYTVGHTCLTVGSTNNCTTPGFDGSCPSGTSPDGLGFCCPDGGGEVADCALGVGPFRALCPSPVVVDTAGDGFRLTGASGGVLFDIDGDGSRERLSWTQAGADDAWLALDRDGDDLITSGRELFGNFTEQPAPPAGEGRNGFLALAEFDKPLNGGNDDGLIDAADAVFTHLRLWRDANHDGVSQAPELHALSALGVTRLHLSYKDSKRVDEHGNRFKYRAKVDDAKRSKVNRWAWDVFLVASP
jgi:hypothetical protein